MTWHTGRLALFDLESTGLDCHRDRIVSAAIIEAGGGIETRTSAWLVNPGIEIPTEASDIHGILTEDVRAGGVEPAGAVHEIAEHLVRLSRAGVPIVGHNVTYDLTMLWAELIRHEQGVLARHVWGIQPVIDTLVLDKWADPWRPKEPTARRPDPDRCGSRRLTDVARLYGVPLTEADAHGAAADALAAGRVAWKLAVTYPGLQMTLAELHAEQQTWKAEQAASFGEWLERQGKTDDVSRSWPLQPPPEGWSPADLPMPREGANA